MTSRTDLSHLPSTAQGAIGAGASGRARIRVRGADARRFLHRLSTNAVDALEPGAGRLNCLVTDKGRFVDVLHHLALGEDEVLLVGSEGTGEALVAWLDRYLFTEKVELHDASGEGSAVEIGGGGAAAVVERLVEGAARLERWAFAQAGARIAVRTFDLIDEAGRPVPAYVVVDLEAREPALRAAAEGAGAIFVDEDAYEVARVAAGVPRIGAEISDRYNPLDLELHDAVHWAKGCYIGQEVIARLDTYQKQSRRSYALRLDDEARATTRPGDAILIDGKPAGEVTRVAPSTWADRPNALGMIRFAEKTDEASVQVKRADGSVVEAQATTRVAAQRPHD